MTAAQIRIAQTIELFYDDGNPMGQSGTDYKRVMEKLDEEAKTDLVKAMNGSIRLFIPLTASSDQIIGYSLSNNCVGALWSIMLLLP